MQREELEGKLICLLLKCRQRKDLRLATRLHAYMREQRLDSHPVLANYLVPTLIDCGSLAEAQHVFDLLRPPHRNEHSWTSLISAYAQHGAADRAFHLYHSMLQCSFASPTGRTYLALLHACTGLCDLDSGRRIHAETTKRGLAHEVYMGSSLVHMYAKCGLLLDASLVLDRLTSRNVVSWTALITGYVEHGLGEEVLRCFKRMQIEGVPADAVTFLCSLKACNAIELLETGREIHTETTKRGLERELYLGSALVDMYTKCGSFDEAHLVFGHLQHQDAVSWNSLIAGYAECGLEEELIKCFWQMQLRGVCADAVTFVCSMKSCSSQTALHVGQLMFAEATKRGLEKEVHISSTLVDLYGKLGLLDEAYHVFDRVPTRNEFIWTAMIAGYAEHGFGGKALSCFKQMQQEGLAADAGTLICSLKACSAVGSLEVGKAIHAELMKKGLESELYVGSTLVDLYGKCGLLVDSRHVFERLPNQNTVSWTALIGGYVGHYEHGCGEELLSYFKQMQVNGVPADAAALVNCLKVCSAIGALELGREIHAEIRKTGLEGAPFVGHMLIDMYGKCGSLAEGREVFEKLSVQDVSSWTAMINAYGENHEGKLAVECFKEMQEGGVEPNDITFACVLAACSHASMVIEGQEYFRVMRENHHIEPTVAHCACLVDLFGRSGHVYEAERFIAAMQCPPSSVFLMSLLSACKMYGKVQLGERCFQQLVELKEEAAAYMLIADIYTGAGMFADASKIEEMRNRIGANKKPGSAILQVCKNVHEFVVGVISKETTAGRRTASLRLKDEGYVPFVDLVLGLRSNEEKEERTCGWIDNTFANTKGNESHFESKL